MAIGRTNAMSGVYMAPVLLLTSQTWTVPYSGKYRVCAVGHGGSVDAFQSESRSALATACGGAGYVEVVLAKGTQIAVSISTSATSFGSYITATAGTDASSSGSGVSGSVSGDGVVAFESNSRTGQGSIIPPAIYADKLSSGGLSGAFLNNDTETVGTVTGGSGVFGGVGGNGASVVWYSSASYTVAFSPTAGGVGGGSGGTARSPYSPIATSSLVRGYGGGGGLGGAGSVGEWRRYSASKYILSGYGQGGAGGVYIEKIS